MEPEFNMERWNDERPPAPVTNIAEADGSSTTRSARRSRRTSRRPRSEATRTMLEMLRALAQSEAGTLEAVTAFSPAPAAQPDTASHRDEPEEQQELSHAEVAAETPEGPATDHVPGLMLLRAKVFGSEPEDVELHCRYCDRIFKLQEGGASFEGNAACSNCEQHLNREFVLPAVSKHRPNLYQVCDVAEGPGDPKRPAWGRHRSGSRKGHRDADQPSSVDPADVTGEATDESLQEAGSVREL